ncbi:MAG: hypothetical protein JRG90_17105 [Deltaproteobacteria bacterium]|nr:hypothetical protein [Deltaproteobacteria bacterium]
MYPRALRASSASFESGSPTFVLSVIREFASFSFISVRKDSTFSPLGLALAIYQNMAYRTWEIRSLFGLSSDELHGEAIDGLKAEVEFLKESGATLGVNKVEIQELRSAAQVAGDSTRSLL